MTNSENDADHVDVKTLWSSAPFTKSYLGYGRPPGYPDDESEVQTQSQPTLLERPMGITFTGLYSLTNSFLMFVSLLRLTQEAPTSLYPWNCLLLIGLIVLWGSIGYGLLKLRTWARSWAIFAFSLSAFFTFLNIFDGLFGFFAVLDLLLTLFVIAYLLRAATRDLF